MVRSAPVPVYRDSVKARGHQAIRAQHPSTFELTKDSYLTERGDCIIGVDLDRGVAELDEELKRALKRSTSIVVIVLKADDIVDIVLAQGNENLALTDERRIIVRRSSYIDGATLAVNANKSAKNIRRDLIEKLRNSQTVLDIDIYVIDLGSAVRLWPR